MKSLFAVLSVLACAPAAFAQSPTCADGRIARIEVVEFRPCPNHMAIIDGNGDERCFQNPDQSVKNPGHFMSCLAVKGNSFAADPVLTWSVTAAKQMR